MWYSKYSICVIRSQWGGLAASGAHNSSDVTEHPVTSATSSTYWSSSVVELFCGPQAVILCRYIPIALMQCSDTQCSLACFCPPGFLLASFIIIMFNISVAYSPLFQPPIPLDYAKRLPQNLYAHITFDFIPHNENYTLEIISYHDILMVIHIIPIPSKIVLRSFSNKSTIFTCKSQQQTDSHQNFAAASIMHHKNRAGRLQSLLLADKSWSDSLGSTNPRQALVFSQQSTHIRDEDHKQSIPKFPTAFVSMNLGRNF